MTGKTTVLDGIFLLGMILSLSCAPAGAEPETTGPAEPANRINTIKTFDLLIPRILDAQQMDPEKPDYGSIPIKNESQFFVYEVIYGLAWRYNHDLTAELGCKDPYYHNEKVLKSALAMGEYVISRQKPGWGWTRGFVANAFIGRSLARAYRQLEPCLDNAVKDRKAPAEEVACEGNIGDTDDMRGNSPNHIWIAPAERWSDVLKEGEIDYRLATSMMSYFYYMSGDCGRYDKNNDGIIDAPFNLTIKYKDTGAEARVKILLTDRKWSMLGTLESKGDNQWKAFSCDIAEVAAKRFNMMIQVYSGKGVPVDSIMVTARDAKGRPARLLTQREYWYASLVRAGEGYLKLPVEQNWFVQNQFLVAKHFLLELYHVTNDRRFLDYVLAGLNKCTFKHPYTQDGIPCEWNEEIVAATARKIKKLGYDPQYAVTSQAALTEIYRLLPEGVAEREKIKAIMIKHFDTLQYLTMPRADNYHYQGAFGCRGNARIYNFEKMPVDHTDIHSDFLPAPFVFAPCSKVAGKWAAIINDNFRTPSQPYGLAKPPPEGHGLEWAGHEAHQFIDAYELWKPCSSDYELINDRKEGYIKNLEELKVVAVKTGGYIINISYGSATPSGGVIADVYSLAGNQHLFSGRAGQNLYGLNAIVYEEDGKTASNNFDTEAACKVLSEKPPYAIEISGTLRHIDQTTAPINYKITYCFKDKSIAVTNDLEILDAARGRLYVIATPIKTGSSPVIAEKSITCDCVTIEARASLSAEAKADGEAAWGQVHVVRMFEQPADGKTTVSQEYEILLRDR